MKILVACEESQAVTEQLINRGHNAMSCDLDYYGAKGLPHYKGDVLEIINNGWDMLIAFPPCTFMKQLSILWMTHYRHLKMNRRLQ